MIRHENYIYIYTLTFTRKMQCVFLKIIVTMLSWMSHCLFVRAVESRYLHQSTFSMLLFFK